LFWNRQGILLLKAKTGAVNQEISISEGFFKSLRVPIDLANRKSAGDKRGKFPE
jgi:hypothetical protein